MIKKIILVFYLIGFAAAAFAADDTISSVLYVYYFHGNARCPTCRKLEEYSKAAIDGNFREKVSSGKVIFRAVNVEEKVNEHFVKDYRLYTKSLVISLTQNGKEVKAKNLEKVWEYVGNKQKFIEYVTYEINSFLKGE